MIGQETKDLIDKLLLEQIVCAEPNEKGNMKFVRVHGWHRHITFVFAAQTFLTGLRHLAKPVFDPPTPPFDDRINSHYGCNHYGVRLIVRLSI